MLFEESHGKLADFVWVGVLIWGPGLDRTGLGGQGRRIRESLEWMLVFLSLFLSCSFDSFAGWC